MNSKSIAQKLSGASVALVLGLMVNPESAQAVTSPAATGEQLLRPTLLINNSEDATVLTENSVSEQENINSNNASAEESWTMESPSVSNTPLSLPSVKAELQNSSSSTSVFIADNRTTSNDSVFTGDFVVASGDSLLPTESVISQTPNSSIPIKVQLPTNNNVEPQSISIPVSLENGEATETASVTIPVLPPSQGLSRTTANATPPAPSVTIPVNVVNPVNTAVNNDSSEPVLISNNTRGDRTENLVSQSVRTINPAIRETNNGPAENLTSQNIRIINPPAEEIKRDRTENLVSKNIRTINPPAREQNNNSDGSQLVSTIPIQVEYFDPTSSPSAREMGFPDLPQINSPARYLPENQKPGNGFIWPARGVFTSGYGWRWGRMHRGIDIAGPVGTPIVAAADGEVITAGWNSGGFGNLVRIKHFDGSVTLYAHNSRILVRRGEFVNQGQLIAKMGSTGFSTGPHLHFEIHPPGSRPVDPLAFLPRK